MYIDIFWEGMVFSISGRFSKKRVLLGDGSIQGQTFQGILYLWKFITMPIGNSIQGKISTGMWEKIFYMIVKTI